MTGGKVYVDQYTNATASQVPAIKVTGGELHISQAYIANYQIGNAYTMSVFGTGLLEVRTSVFDAGSGCAGASAGMIHQSGSGVLRLSDDSFTTNCQSLGVNIGSDNAFNSIQNVQWNGWSFSGPSGVTLGTYTPPPPMNQPAGDATSLGIGSGAYNNLASAAAGGHYNVAVGAGAMAGAVTTGALNSAFGRDACGAITTGVNNTCDGPYAGQILATGQQNTMVGQKAGAAITSGDGNTFLGYQAGTALVSTSSANTVIGAGALPTGVGANLQLVIGNGALPNFQGGIVSNTVIGNGVAPGLTTGGGDILIGTSSATNVPTGSTSNYLNIGGVLTGNISTGALAISGSAASLAVPTVIMPLTTPASSSAACTAGQVAVDANYIYVCTATNTWKRAPGSTW